MQWVHGNAAVKTDRQLPAADHHDAEAIVMADHKLFHIKCSPSRLVVSL